MNLETMKATALRATQGDWVRRKDGDEDEIVSINHSLTPQEIREQGLFSCWNEDKEDHDHSVIRILDSSEWMNCSDFNLEFMIACSPKNVLRLIDAYERLKATQS